MLLVTVDVVVPVASGTVTVKVYRTEATSTQKPQIATKVKLDQTELDELVRVHSGSRPWLAIVKPGLLVDTVWF